MTRYRTTGRRAGAPKPRAEAQGLVVYGPNAVAELLRSGGAVDRVRVGQGDRAPGIVAAARACGVAVEPADRDVLDRLAGSPHHHGVVATCPPYHYAQLADVLDAEPRSALVLDGIQDPRNLGATLRTARASGVDAVVLPTDRSVGITSVVVAASAGLLFGLRIARVPNLVRAMGALKAAGLWLIGLVPRGGQPLYGFAPPPRPALVVGGEGEGLRELVRKTCDFTVTIPMAPGVESLNAAVASSLALYELLVRRGHGST